MKLYPIKKQTILSVDKKKHANHLIENFKNPDISHINHDSNFIYDESSALAHYNKVKNKNTIKLTEQEQKLFINVINEIKIQKLIDNKQELIDLPFDLYDKIKNFKPKVKSENEELEEFIKTTIENCNNRRKISCRKLASLYEKNKGKKIGKSTIHKILRKSLGYRYLKTTYKTKKLKSEISILHCFYFIKCFAKCLKLNFHFIFIDESKIELSNNHLRCWRKENEQIMFGDIINEKKNIILAIDKSSVLEYEITHENTNGIIFYNFIVKLKKKLDFISENKYVLVMDNCTSHKTEDILKYFKSNKINILFTPAYQSIFNPIELIFRGIKRMTYSKLYNNFEEVENDLINYLKNDKIKNTLLYNFKETMEQILAYYELNMNQNMNNYEL